MGMMNGGMNGGDGSDDGDKPNKPVGYKSPPHHGRIKPGEVRNPHGRNGRKEEQSDNFEKVRRGPNRVTVNGETRTVENEEAFWLSHWVNGMGKNNTSARIVAKELAARRVSGPPPLTAEELTQEAAELARRQQLSATIVDALERMAAAKRDDDGGPRVRYGLDGRPIVEPPADEGAPKPEPLDGAAE